MTDMLFILNKDITAFDAKDGIEERLTQVKSILKNILNEAANCEPNINYEALFNSLWIVERLINEVEILQTVISKP